MAVPARVRLRRGMIALLGCSHLGLEGCHHFLPVTVPLLLAVFDIEYVHYGNLAFAGVLLTTGAQPLFGWLADRWRPEFMVPLSIAWVGMGMALSGIMPSFLLLSVVVIAASLGSAMYHPAAAVLTLRYAGARPGTMFSLFSLGGTLGVAVSPLLINYALPKLGLSATLIYAPVALAAAGGVYLGFLRLRSPMRSPSRRHRRKRDPGRRLSKSHGFLLGVLLLSVMTRSWVYGAFASFLPAWALAAQGSPTVGGELLAVFAVGGAAGALAGGYAVDRIAGWKILGFSMTVLSLALWGTFVAQGLWLYALVFVLGAAEGSTLPVPVIMARSLLPDRQGVAASLMMGIAWLPAGIGAWATGLRADLLGIENALNYLVWLPLLGVVGILVFAAVSSRLPVCSLGIHEQ